MGIFSKISPPIRTVFTGLCGLAILSGLGSGSVGATDMQYYVNRADTVGYEPGVTFEPPTELQPAVTFWKKVYTQYTTKQSVIHDSVHLQVIYTAIDFTNIVDNPRLSESQKRKIREDKTEEVKKRYREILARLDKVDMEELSLSALDQEELRIYKLFEGVQEPYRFDNSKARLRSQVGQRNEFIRGIVDSGAFIQEMEEIFRSYRLPTQLVRLSFVESMFNTKALSKVNASGIWQFMPSTGRFFLRIDHLVDERNDPILATHAAARLLMQNFQTLEEWPIAVTAYNHGRAGMARAVQKVGSRHLPDIITRYKSNSFGFASRNFYAQFLAAVDVEKNYSKYFGPLVRTRPVRYDILRLPDHVALKTISEYCRVAEDELIDLNPGLTNAVINSNHYIPSDYDLKIPRGRKDDFLLAYANIPDEYRQSLQESAHWHKVRRGEVLSRIARNYRISVGHLLQANGLSSANHVYVGQLLKVPQESRYLAKLEVQRPKTFVEAARAPKAKVTYPQMKILPLEETETAPPESEMAQVVPAELHLASVEEEAVHANESAVEIVPQLEDKTTPQAEALVAQILEKTPSTHHIIPTGSTPLTAEATPSGFGALISLFDPENKDKLLSLAPSAPESQDIVGWNFRYENLNPKAANDAPFAGSTVVTDGETAGHLAEWCRISTPQFRRLNQLKFVHGLGLGQKVKLECLVPLEEFHHERLAYHRSLQADFLKDCPSLEIDTHRVAENENIWDLANKVYGTPIWLIQKHNPSKDLTVKLPAGSVLRIPKCTKVASL